MRGLSIKFMMELKSGFLQPILERIKKDNTLMLSIRKNYINIYYRGGNIINVEEKLGSFTFSFNKEYDLSSGDKSYHELCLPERITNPQDVKKWTSSIVFLKEMMDFYLTTKKTKC